MGQYSVNTWGSKPGTNDDCWMGIDFASEVGAVECFDNPERFFNLVDVAFVELDGPGVHKERRVGPDNGPDDFSDWNREAAIQSGMVFGCAGYNDSYGW